MENPFINIDYDEMERLIDRSLPEAKETDRGLYVRLMERKAKIIESKKSGGKHD